MGRTERGWGKLKEDGEGLKKDEWTRKKDGDGLKSDGAN